MRVYVLSYDLRDVRADSNAKASQALQDYFISSEWIEYREGLFFPRWVVRNLPDTTVVVAGADDSSAQSLVDTAYEVINTAGCRVARIFAAEMDPGNHYAFDNDD